MIIVASDITPWSTILLRILIRIVVAENLNPKQSYLRRVQVCVCVRVRAFVYACLCVCAGLYMSFGEVVEKAPSHFRSPIRIFFRTPFVSSGTLSIYCKRF